MSEFEQIDEYVKQNMTAVDDMGHDYDHVKRVFSMCIEIGKKMGANLKVLGAAALLHDVGRIQEIQTGISHSITSGEMGELILERIGYSQEEIEDVRQAIRTHRFSEGLTPTSLEGKILSDADKLDAIGAIGVYRAIAHSNATGVGIDGFLRHADEKLLGLRDMMYTDLGEMHANERHAVLNTFVENLRSELGHVDSLDINNSR
jgi:uncharacterized protein